MVKAALQRNYRLVVVAILSLASLFAATTFGAANISATEFAACLLNECSNAANRIVISEIRLPRVILGFVAGAGLAVAGVVLQNTTRNPLADPYLFGVVSGAGLGATVATLVVPPTIALAIPVAAFFGALSSVVIIILIATVIRQITALVLAGVAVSFMLSSLTQFLLYLGEPFATNRVIFWLMGSLSRAEMAHVQIIIPVVIVAMLLIMMVARQTDALLLGDETAQTLGVNVNRIRILMLIVCAALTAIVVAYCGGIGFVGLMIPHIARQWFGVTTMKLVLGSALLGGCFLIWVDVIARTALQGQEIPIGVITSAIGSVFFLLVMHQRRGQFNG